MRKQTGFRIILLSVFVFIGYGVLYANTDNEQKSVNETNEATVTLNIVANSASSYSIVYGAAGGTVAKNNATQLVAAIKSITGCTLTTKTDATAATTYEIILGPTNTRADCAEMNTSLGSFGYRIAVSGKKLVITATDANHMVVALKRFETAILKSSTLAGTGFLNFSNTNDQYADFSQTQATLRSIISNGYSYTFSQTLVCSCPKDGTIYVAQGAGTDGTYFYFCNRTSGDTSSRVYKYKMDGTYVSKTAAFAGNHSNDLTVDTKNGRVLIVNGTGAPTKLTPIDTKTMAVGSNITVGRGVGALAYCPERDAYAGSQGGSCVFYMGADLSYSSDKNYSRNNTTEGTSAYTAQGMGCDVDYVYFPMSGSSNNAIVAYDWKGNYKKTFFLSIGTESESLFEINGVYYVNFYSSGDGARLYRINITLSYTSGV